MASTTFLAARRASPCACGGRCPHCAGRGEREARDQARQALSAPADRSAPLRALTPHGSGAGVALAPEERAFMEPRFGYDFADVRIHSDERAAQSADAVGARAFTHGTDIVFGRDQYRRGGRALLAHELSHVVQQAGEPPTVPLGIQRAEFADSCGDLSSEEDGGGVIDVYAGIISMPALAVSHLYIVYTSTGGRRFAFRGGPDNQGGGYGHIMSMCAPYVAGFTDFNPDNPSVRVYSGPDARQKARCMHGKLADLAGRDVPYEPFGPNSNSVVAHLLRECGLPLRSPHVTAPGFNLTFAPTGTGTADRGFIDRRQRLSLGLGPLFGPGAELATTAGYSVDTALLANQTFRAPLTLGALYAPGSRTALGSASIGLETPFLHLPLPGARAPTSLGLSVGVAGGVSPVPTGGTAGALGPQVRASFGADVDRVRLTLFYQYNYLRSLGHDHERSLHMLGLEAGITF